MRVVFIFSYLKSTFQLRGGFVWFLFFCKVFLLVYLDFVVYYSHFLILGVFYYSGTQEFLDFFFYVDEYLLRDYIFRFFKLVSWDFWFDKDKVIFWIWKLVVLYFISLKIRILFLKFFDNLEPVLKFQFFVFVLKYVHWILFRFDIKCLN